MDDFWMARTHENEILGPFSKSDLIAQINEGKFGPEDEVCRVNSYWIYLDEREEVQKQLGIEVHRVSPMGEDDEVTATETLTQEMVRTAEAAAGHGTGSEMMRKPLPRPARARPSHAPIRASAPQKVELPLAIRMLIYALMVILGILVAWLIQLLHRH